MRTSKDKDTMLTDERSFILRQGCQGSKSAPWAACVPTLSRSQRNKISLRGALLSRTVPESWQTPTLSGNASCSLPDTSVSRKTAQPPHAARGRTTFRHKQQLAR